MQKTTARRLKKLERHLARRKVPHRVFVLQPGESLPPGVDQGWHFIVRLAHIDADQEQAHDT